MRVKPEFIKTLHYLDAHNHDFKFKHYLFNAAKSVQLRTNETIVGWQSAHQVALEDS